MNAGERGFLLLTSRLGDPERQPMTTAQFRTLAARARNAVADRENRQLLPKDLVALGYSEAEAQRIWKLLQDRELLEYYAARGLRMGCIPVTRVSEGYPLALRKKLGDDSPGCLWMKGQLSALEMPKISVVGSRDLRPENRDFARRVGRWAANHGFALVSGNARGADRTAQDACLAAGGTVICVVADSLKKQELQSNMLLISEESYDAEFSAQRALSRNRVIHSLSSWTVVAQARRGIGGTWHGTEQNLRRGWSKVLCFDDGSEAAAELAQMGAALLTDMPESPRQLTAVDRGFFKEELP